MQEEKLNDYHYNILYKEIIIEINKTENRFYLLNGKQLALTNCETEQNK